MTGWCGAQGRVGGEGVLRLGDADRQVAVAHLLQFLDLLADLGARRDLRCPVDAGGDGAHLVPQRGVIGVDEGEFARRLAQLDDLAGERLGACPAIRPVGGEDHIRAGLGHEALEQVDLGIGVGGEAVDGHDAVDAVYIADVLDVALEVDDALLERLEVLVGDRREVCAAMVLQGSNGGDDHGDGWPEAGLAALDVDELLRAEVGAEACLGDDVVGELEGSARGHDCVAAVGDIGEGPAVHEGGRVLEGLDKIGVECVLEQHRHGAVRVKVPRPDGLLVAVVGHDDVAHPLLEVVERGGQAEDRHDL